MNTFKTAHVTFICNGDFSGDVIINHEGQSMKIETSDLLDFVAMIVQGKRLKKLNRQVQKSF